MDLINLTTQPISVYREEDVVNGELVDRHVQPLITIPPHGEAARARFYADTGDPIVVGGVEVPVVGLWPTTVRGLPRRADDVFYIVTNTVRNRLPERDDLLVIGKKVFNNGQVIGCTNLTRHHT